MHTVTILYFHGDQTFLFADKETADSAYQAVSDALKDYRRFKNDSQECVEFDGPDGRNTIKLEHINSVSITNTDNPLQVEWARFHGRLKAAMQQEEQAPVRS